MSMGEYHRKLSLDGVAQEEFMCCVDRFYLQNGYHVLPNEQEDGVDKSRACYQRGKRGAGWWTSNMTELFSEVVASFDEDTSCGAVELTVDTTGQMLSEDDRAFWEAELAALQAHVLGSDAEPKDLRKRERKRSKKGKRATLQKSAYGFLLAFVVLFMVMLLLHRIGLIAF